MNLKYLFIGLYCVAVATSSAVGAQKLSLKRTVPHESTAYTQGLFFYNGFLYESIGLYGRSEIRRLDAKTGRILQSSSFPRQYFAEGSCAHGGMIFVLSWMEQTCFVIHPKTLKIQAKIPYEGEGWGLCSDGQSLIMSNGSSEIVFRDPASFKIKRKITVKYKGRAQDQLNELEYINGHIWANVYMTDFVLVIDPKTGNVQEKMDFTSRISGSQRGSNAEVMNGIAWNPDTRQLWLTGKFWSNFFCYSIIP